MTDCESIQDRIPLVADGVASWSEQDSVHLAACPACAAEWQVVQTAKRLGDTAARRVDAARVSSAVLARLASERRAARWRRGGWLAGLAAAAAVVLIVKSTSHPLVQGTGTSRAAGPVLHVPIAELEQLDARQLEAVLEGLDEPLGSRAAPDAPHLGDLDDYQLERVLRSLEG